MPGGLREPALPVRDDHLPAILPVYIYGTVCIIQGGLCVYSRVYSRSQPLAAVATRWNVTLTWQQVPPPKSAQVNGVMA